MRIFAHQEFTVMVDLWHHWYSFHIPVRLHSYCVRFNLFITHWKWCTDYAQAKETEEVSEDFTPGVFVSWFATFWLSDDVHILLPSARQSVSLFVQGLRKVSVRSLAVLFCLSVSFATSPPSCRHVFWAGMAGWELSKLPAASHASSVAVTRRDGRHSTQLVKSTLMLGRGGKKRERNQIFISPPVRHLPISLEVRECHQLMTMGRRRHQHWHKNSMFQASGGIMQGLLLYRR